MEASSKIIPMKKEDETKLFGGREITSEVTIDYSKQPYAVF